MNYQYAKFHDFIKKFTINVIFRWLKRYFMCYKLALPNFLSVEHRSPRCSKTPFTQIVCYIDTYLWYEWCFGTPGGTVFYKYFSFLVDYIAKKWHFCPKISKIRQCMEVILSETNGDLSYKVQNKTIFQMFVGWNFCPYREYIADIVNLKLFRQLIMIEETRVLK